MKPSQLQSTQIKELVPEYSDKVYQFWIYFELILFKYGKNVRVLAVNTTIK
jgi:hypothetical protein